MGKIKPIPDNLLRVIRRELRKYGVTLVRNKKTDAIFLRQLSVKPASQATEAQSISRTSFTECSRKASLWIKSNDERACPPSGTPEYQSMMKSFKRQDKIKRFLNFVMTKIDHITDIPQVLRSSSLGTGL